jgi:membrane protein YdbS with pleckstrin-like domain
MIASGADARPAEPAEWLDRRAVSVWRINNLFLVFWVIVVLTVATLILVHGTERVSDWVVIALAVLLASLALFAGWYVPDLEWRHWRYEIRPDEIDIKHGWLTTTRTLVPMSRVQHIDTRRSPVERRYRAASLIIHTAGGTIAIPALPDEVAAAVGARIMALANIHDDL